MNYVGQEACSFQAFEKDRIAKFSWRFCHQSPHREIYSDSYNPHLNSRCPLQCSAATNTAFGSIKVPFFFNRTYFIFIYLFIYLFIYSLFAVKNLQLKTDIILYTSKNSYVLIHVNYLINIS